jgi:hypothetical protein
MANHGETFRWSGTFGKNPAGRHPVASTRLHGNVRGEPVFSVMAAGWFCEKSGWIAKVEDVKPVLLDFNRQSFWGGGRRIFARMNCEIGKFHSVLSHLGPDIIWF